MIFDDPIFRVVLFLCANTFCWSIAALFLKRQRRLLTVVVVAAGNTLAVTLLVCALRQRVPMEVGVPATILGSTIAGGGVLRLVQKARFYKLCLLNLLSIIGAAVLWGGAALFYLLTHIRPMP